MTTYTLTVQTATLAEIHTPLSATSDASAIRAARALADNDFRSIGALDDDLVFLSWHRDDDNCSGYINPDGSTSPSGGSWR